MPAMSIQQRTALASVAIAATLAAVKLAAGLLSHSLGMIAEAIHSNVQVLMDRVPVSGAQETAREAIESVGESVSLRRLRMREAGGRHFADVVVAVPAQTDLEAAHSVASAIEHAVGLELRDEQLLVFGDPRAGTPLMQEDPAIGYELPLRVLIWDAQGQTLIAHRPMASLAGEYEISEHAALLTRMNGLLDQLVAEAVAAD
jgi:divalent metal cation (Fe/Co/Zn/Cd) transporter